MNLQGPEGVDQEYLSAGRESAMKRLGDTTPPDLHPVTEEESVAFVERNYDKAGERLSRYYSMILMAYLWRFGVHHYFLNRNFQFQFIPKGDRINRPYVNLVGPEVESLKGKLLRATPRGMVYPNSNDPRDRLGASKATSFLRFKDEEDHIDAKTDQLVDMAAVCGDAFAEVDIDGSSGEITEIDPSDLGDQVSPEMMGEPIRLKLSDEVTNVFLPLQVIRSRGASDVDRDYMIHTHSFLEFESARSMYGKAGRKIKPTTTPPTAGQFQWRLLDLMSELDATGYSQTVGWSGGESPTGYDQTALAHVVRIKADDDYPEGRYFVVVGGAVCYAGPMLRKRRFLHYQWNAIPGAPYGVGLVKDLIPINKHLEQMLYQAAYTRRAVQPYWISAKQSGLTRTKGDTESTPGMYLEYNWHPSRPQPKLEVPHATMDAGFVQEVNLFLKEFLGTASGTKNVLSGDRPVGAYSGVALRQLQAQASDRLAPRITLLHGSVERWTSFRLQAIAEAPKWQIPQLIPYPGRAGRREFMMFSSADLRDNFTYRIEAEAKAVTDEVTKAQTAFDAWQNGGIDGNDPVQRERFLSIVGLPEFADESSIHLKRARWEDAMMADGNEMHVGPFEDNAMHLRQHVSTIMSEEFTTYPEETQALLMAHAEETRQAIEDEMAVQSVMEQNGMIPPSMANPNGNGGGKRYGPPANGAMMSPQVALGSQLPPGGRGMGGGAQ